MPEAKTAVDITVTQVLEHPKIRAMVAEVVDEIVRTLVAGHVVERTPTHADRAIALVCSEFGVTRDELQGSGRVRSISRPRYVAYAALRQLGMSYPEIGHILHRDHATVLVGVRKAKADDMLSWYARKIAEAVR